MNPIAKEHKEEKVTIVEGLKFQLASHFDRTVFTIEKIVNGKVVISWPGSMRTQDYTLKDAEYNFKFKDWLPLEPDKAAATPTIPVTEKQESDAVEAEYWNRVVATIASFDLCNSVKPTDGEGIDEWKRQVIDRLKREGFRLTKAKS